MKILKFSGIVVGIHLLALILIFANPGCSSSTKPPPAPPDTVSRSETAPTIAVPGSPAAAHEGGTAPGISFNSDPATLNAGVRYSPTRPGTPAASTLQVEPVNNVTPATTYTVANGDSLWSIANKNHLTVSELAAVNNLSVKSNPKLHPGQKLIIPGKVAAPVKLNEPAPAGMGLASPAGAATETASAKPTPEGVRHTVKAGDTLSTIARKYGVKQGDIAVANNISDPQKIRLGMELIIPGWQAPASKMSRSSKAASDAGTHRDADSMSSPAPTPDPATDSSARAPASEVPVIQVEEAPAAAK